MEIPDLTRNLVAAGALAIMSLTGLCLLCRDIKKSRAKVKLVPFAVGSAALSGLVLLLLTGLNELSVRESIPDDDPQYAYIVGTIAKVELQKGEKALLTVSDKQGGQWHIILNLYLKTLQVTLKEGVRVRFPVRFPKIEGLPIIEANLVWRNYFNAQGVGSPPLTFP